MSSRERTLQILARRDPLSDEEWQALIEARVAAVVELAKYVSLDAIRAVPCLRYGDYVLLHAIGDNQPVFKGTQGISLDTRGIFAAQSIQLIAQDTDPLSDVPDVREGFRTLTSRIWGLTRNRMWIVARVSCQMSDDPDRRFPVPKPIQVEVRQCELSELVSARCGTYRDIWCLLARDIGEWREDRERILRETIELERRFGFELQLLKLLSKKTT